MSRHDYMSSSGFAEQGYSDHVLNTVPKMNHNVSHGSRTYVTKVETHIQEIRQPRTKVYSYTTPVKVDPSKGRPIEVDRLITRILDEVNGPPTSSIRESSGPVWDHHSPPVKVQNSIEYGVEYRFGGSSPTKARPRRDYGTDYTQGGSPVKSHLPRDYGDPYDQKDRPRGNVHDQLLPKDYGVPDKMWDGSYRKPDVSRDRIPKNGHSVVPETSRDYRSPNNQWGESHLKPETLTEHEAPKPQWERSPYSIYEPSPHSPSAIRSETFEDYGSPKNKWGNTFLKPEFARDDGVTSPRMSQSEISPKLVHDHSIDNHSPRKSDRPKEHIASLNPWGSISVKPQSPKSQGDADKSRNKPSNIYNEPPVLDSIGVPKSRLARISVKPLYPEDYGGPYNEQDRSPSPEYDHRLDRTFMKPQSSGGDNRQDRSSDIVYSSPRSNVGVGGVPNDPWENSPRKSQNVHDYRASGKEQDRSSAPMYSSPRSNGGIGGVPNDSWDNSPRKSQNVHDYGAPDKEQGRPAAPAYNSPRLNGGTGGVPNDLWGNSPTRSRSIHDYGAPNKKYDTSSAPVHSPPRAYGGIGGAPNDLRGNSQRKAPSIHDYGAPSKEYGTTSAPVFNSPRASGGIGGVPNDLLGNSPRKTPSNQLGRLSDPIYAPPSPKGGSRPVNGTSMPNGNIGGVPMDQRDNPPAKTPSNQLGRSSNPIYEPPSQKEGFSGTANDTLRNSPVKSKNVFDHGGPKTQQGRPSGSVFETPVPFSSIGGVPNEQRADPPAKTKSYQSHKGPGNQLGKSLGSDNYKPPSLKGGIGGIANDRLSNSPVKSQNLPDQGGPNNQQGRSSGNVYGTPRPNGNIGGVATEQQDIPPAKVQNHLVHGGPDHQRGKASPTNYETPSPKRNIGGVPDDRWRNTPLKTQNVPDHGGPNIKQVMPSRNTYDVAPPSAINEQHKEPNVTSKDGKFSLNDKPNVTKGTYPREPNGNSINFQMNKLVGNSYNPHKNSYALKGDDMGLQRVAAGASPGSAGRTSSTTSQNDSQPKFSVPPLQASKQKTIVGTPVINSRDAQRLYGGVNFPSGQYTDEHDYEPVITSEEALARYKGILVPF